MQGRRVPAYDFSARRHVWAGGVNRLGAQEDFPHHDRGDCKSGNGAGPRFPNFFSGIGLRGRPFSCDRAERDGAALLGVAALVPEADRSAT